MNDYRIGAGAGFAGDRLEPAQVLLEHAEIDALVFECLAERTIGLAHQSQAIGDGTGYDPRLLQRLEAALPLARRHGTAIITNAGAANPLGAARAARALADQLGVTNLPVAAVTGDDVLSVLDPDAPLFDTDETVRDLGDRIVSANAYLGAEGVEGALSQGAQVVITGRIADAALFSGAISFGLGWDLHDERHAADATLVGHLLECAGQLSGGYFADGSRKRVPGLATLGFPYAEVGSDGYAVYAKVEGTGGMLTRETVLEQLLYEIDDATAYRTPDVTLDMSRVSIERVGIDRVRVGGAIPHGRPEKLKVSVGVRDGFLAVAEVSYAGAGCVARAALAEQIIRERWSEVHGFGTVLTCDLIGVNSTRPWRVEVREPAEVRLRFAVRTFERPVAQTLLHEVEALYTNGPAGGGGVTTSLRETVGIVSTFIDRGAVAQKVTML